MLRTLRIGATSVQFETSDPELLEAIDECHCGCVASVDPELTIQLSLCDSLNGGPMRPTAHARNGRHTIAYFGWHCTYEEATQTCSARLSRSMASARLTRMVESLTRVVLGRHILVRGGLAFHGAANIMAGQGFAYVGQRGAGKTTVVRTWPGDAVLNDDHALVVPSDDGYRVYGTPYCGRENTPWEAADAPLERILVLEQAPITRMAPLSRAQAFGLLTRHVIHVGYTRDDNARVMAALDALVQKVEVARLQFNLTDPFWPQVQGAAA